MIITTTMQIEGHPIKNGKNRVAMVPSTTMAMVMICSVKVIALPPLCYVTDLASPRYQS